MTCKKDSVGGNDLTGALLSPSSLAGFTFWYRFTRVFLAVKMSVVVVMVCVIVYVVCLLIPTLFISSELCSLHLILRRYN